MRRDERKRVEVPTESMDDLSAMLSMFTARVDPKGKSTWGPLVGGVIFADEPSEDDRELLGTLLCHVLREGTVEHLKLFCDELVKLKQAADELPRRHAWAWLALLQIKLKNGAYPKDVSELRKFIEEHPEKYQEQPSPNGPWTRLWNETGIREFIEEVNRNGPDLV